MNEQKLKELGFKIKTKYTHGSKSEFETKVFKKKTLEIDLDFNKKTKELLSTSLYLENNCYTNLLIDEVKQLDKILNNDKTNFNHR